jgi:hypothetical protein
VLAQLVERDDALQAPFQLHVDHKPARFFALGARIVVLALLVELRRVGIRGAHHLDDARDAETHAARVVHEREIALAEVVAQHVAHLVVAHAVPHRRFLRLLREIIDLERGIRLHEPVIHRFPCP